MVSKKKIVTVLMVMAMVSAAAGMAAAFGPEGGMHGRDGGFMGMRTLMQLNLTDAQKTEVAGIFNSAMGQREETRAKMKEARKQLRESIHAEQYDEQEVKDAFAQMTPIMEEMTLLRARTFSGLRQVLDEEQMEKLGKNRGGCNKKQDDSPNFRKQMLNTWLNMKNE